MKKYTKKTIQFLIIILVAVFLEITLFNFRYWQVRASGLEEKRINISKENIKSETYENFKFKKEVEVELDEKVLNLKYNISTNSKKNVVISTKFVDNSAKYEEKKLEDIVYNVDFKDSDYLVLNSMQECKKINIEIESYNTVNIDSITINTWYFNFNIYRVLTIIVITMIIANLKLINEFFEKNKQYKNIIYITIIGSIFVGYLAYARTICRISGKV